MSTKQRDVSPQLAKAPLVAYWRVWRQLTKLQFQQQIANARAAALFFLFGKLFRLAFAFLFVYVILDRAKVIAGYNLGQAVFILALFNFVSTLSQLFFRGVYMFRQKVVDGTFDFYLLNPLNELFYALFSYTDPLDLLLIIPYSGITIWAWLYAGYSVTFSGILFLLFSTLIMLIFVFALHVFVVAIGIRYLEVDNTIMLYRDLEKMAAFPIEVYGKYLSVFLTYLIPFALMATIPARYIFGLTSPSILLLFFPLSLLFTKLALRYWHSSLRTYSSASS